MKIIDIHAHIYPDAIAQKAADVIGDFYGIPMSENGSVSALLTASEKAGISLSVVHSAAVSANRVARINDFLISAAAAHPDKFLGFGTMHPDFENISGELDRVMEGGLRGIKVHPDFQTFMLDDPKAIEMFRCIADHGLPVIVHTGDHRHPYSQPERMARVLDAVPGLKAVCAHLGGWSVWKEAWQCLAGRDNVWIDTSSSLYALEPGEAVEIIRKYGAKQTFFGTDYPMWEPEEELNDRFMKLPLTEEERELILHKNAEEFFGL